MLKTIGEITTVSITIAAGMGAGIGLGIWHRRRTRKRAREFEDARARFLWPCTQCQQRLRPFDVRCPTCGSSVPPTRHH